MSVAEELLIPDASRPIVELLRQIHRWIALALVLFITVIGATGAILQGLFAYYGAGPGAFARPQGMSPAVEAFHEALVQIHTGAFAGKGGSAFSLICGLGLLFFSISGLWMYLDLYRRRAALGRKGLFWASTVGADGAVRSLHRWFTVALVLFTTMIAFTGSSLDLDVFRGGPPGGPPGGSPPGGPPPAGVPGGGASSFDWHTANFTIHKLAFLGPAGHWIGVFVGLGLVTFAISGLWMYLCMHARRVRAGHKGLFW